MAIIYSTAVLNNRLQEVVNAIDAGPGNGLLNVGTTGMGVVLVSIVLNKPCATVAAGVLTFSGTPIATVSIGNGALAEAILTDSVGTIVASGLSVGLAGSGANIITSAAATTAGDTVTFLSGVIFGV